jgi:homoserine dehydrogenase
MDGAPVFSLGKAGLRGCEILELEGILNSTTNFVLARMEIGDAMTDAVEMAQELGFAEADPRYDLEGWDAAVKVCLLANVLMDADLTPFDVEREGITALKKRHVQGALEQGKHLKLLCRAWREKGSVWAEVKVRPVARESLFGLTSGAASVLRISTDLMGPVTICQEEPTLYDTAYGILNDLLTLRDVIIPPDQD